VTQPSFPFIYQDMTHLKVRKLYDRAGFDAMVKSSKTELELIGKISDWANKQWGHTQPLPYPAWDANEILDKAEKGDAFWCTFKAALFVQGCNAVGLTARMLGINPFNEAAHTVTEVYNNAVEHAHRFEAGREVVIRAHRCARGLQVDVADEGPGFSPAEVAHPSPVQPTQRGLGLFLARQLVDHLEFSHGSGTTVSTRSSPPPPIESEVAGRRLRRRSRPPECPGPCRRRSARSRPGRSRPAA
jgi:hypothetical protein